jgi:integrase
LIGEQSVSNIDEDALLVLRTQRESAGNKKGEPITKSTIKKDFVFIHSALTHARDTLKVIKDVPKTPAFSGTKSIVRQGRPFLTQEEYKTLHTLAKAQAEEPGQNPHSQRQRFSLYCQIVISVGGALRVSEAESIRWCDCETTTASAPTQPRLTAGTP